jgi:hypothetical protein
MHDACMIFGTRGDQLQSYPIPFWKVSGVKVLTVTWQGVVSGLSLDELLCGTIQPSRSLAGLQHGNWL